ncbi:Translation initiation factor eIF-2B subunit gamma [Mycoemilia scoparia]|uniref:Translation initiation factor eIF2B subunit gamma n=1 Tax=Mycoemilia scoparia TaxID=417184 RepID=A0A9W8DWN9_9FUNG|nr:Translation initiation factor eIF-2B subunit gamma [Mycoemilia scoparia]
MHEGVARVNILHDDEMIGTAEVLGNLSDRIKGDVIVTSCDTITDVPAQQFLDLYRLNRPSVAAVFSEIMSSEGGGGSSKDEGKLLEQFFYSHHPRAQHVETKYVVGIDQRSSRLVMLKPTDDDDKSIDVRSSICKRYPSLAISNNFLDAHIYVFSRWVIDFIKANSGITSLQEQLIPLLVRAQSHPQLYSKYRIDEFINPKSEPVVEESMQYSQNVGVTSEQEAPAPKTYGPLSVFAYVRRNCIGGRANNNPRYCDLNKVIARISQAPSVDASASVGAKTVVRYKQMVTTASSSSSLLFNNELEVTTDSQVGRGTKIGQKSKIEKSVVGFHCTIGNNVKITNSVVMDYASIEDGVTLDSSIVCQNVHIGSNSTISKSEIGARKEVPADTIAKGEQLILSGPSEGTSGIAIAFG